MARIGPVHAVAILLALGACACAVPGAPKFGGSFPALLEGWRDNKAAEHSKLERRFD